MARISKNVRAARTVGHIDLAQPGTIARCERMVNRLTARLVHLGVSAQVVSHEERDGVIRCAFSDPAVIPELLTFLGKGKHGWMVDKFDVVDDRTPAQKARADRRAAKRQFTLVSKAA